MRSPCCLCICMCILLSLLCNDPVNTFLRQQWKNCWTRRFLYGQCCIKVESVYLCIALSLLSNGPVSMLPHQRRNVWRIVFYAAHYVTKESRRLFLHRTFCIPQGHRKQNNKWTLAHTKLTICPVMQITMQANTFFLRPTNIKNPLL
jgi:hypothetical protein